MHKRIYNNWLIIFGIILLVSFLRLPSLDEPFENDSGAIAYHGRLILDQEPLYGTHHTGHHLPAAYYTYALAFFILGDSTWSIKFLLIPWTIATALLIYMIGKRLENKMIGLLSAIFFAFLSSNVFLGGTAARAELFANLPITAAILLTIELTLGGSKNWKFAVIGVMSTIAFLYKPGFLFPLIVAVLIIVANAWLTREREGSWRTVTLRIVFIVSGFMASILCVLGYFASQGLLSRFLLVFVFGQNYLDKLGDPLPISFIALAPLYILAINNILLFVLGMAGSIRLFRLILKKNRMDNHFTLVGISLIFWFVFSISAAGITRKSWPYYSIIVVPPLAIIAAWEISQLNRIFSRWLKSAGNRITMIPITIIVVAIVLFSGKKNYNQYYHYVLYRMGGETYQEFLDNGFPYNAEIYKNTNKIAEYIISHTNPDDLVYFWSNDAQMYYLTNRRSPIDMIWTLYAEATGSYQRIFSPKTKYIVVGESIQSPRPKWMYEELEKSYTLEAVIEEQNIYRRIDQ